LVYDLDGRYKEAIPLSGSYQLRVAARFSNGKFLVLGVDPINEVPVIQILDGRGALSLPVQLPHDLERSSPQLEQTVRKADDHPTTFQRLGWSLDLIQLIHYKDSILLIQPGSHKPILEIEPDGLVREITPAVPVSWPLDSAFVSDGSLYLRYNSSTAGVGASSLFQVDAQTGDAIREFLLGQSQAWEINCVEKNTVHLITTMDGQKHTFTLGEARLIAVQPARAKP
jgi:hypothetical protein